ncbi:MAG: hypothetical protein Q7U16_12245 [Agitococcus sp.]|nr:hypothetical protein [Agitococcus sp.]
MTTPRFNPFAHLQTDELMHRIIFLMDEPLPLTQDERIAFEAQFREDEARYREERHGALPPGTYRLLNQGSLRGWRYDLEIDGVDVELEDTGAGSRVAIAKEHALNEIARRHGQAAADSALFRVVWGGEL